MPDMLERLFQNPPNGSLEMVQFQPIWTVARKGIESNKRQFVDCSSPTFSRTMWARGKFFIRFAWP